MHMPPVRTRRPNIPAIERYRARLIEMKAVRVKNLGAIASEMLAIERSRARGLDDMVAFGAPEEMFSIMHSGVDRALDECARRHGLFDAEFALDVIARRTSHRTVYYGFN